MKREHEQAEQQRLWPPELDLEALAEREPEKPKFIISDWLPCGYATLIAGHGGVGKSSIALYLAVCVAAGLPFFGMTLERRRVLYLSCEDREGVLHWRLHRICAHLGISLAGLRGWLRILDLVGCDAVLWERDPSTRDTLTPAYCALHERVREYETELLMIDGITDSYAGNTGAATEIKRYVNSLVALIPPERGAVVLVGHISKQAAEGKATSEGYAGPAGWHNSVRARWYLYPETSTADDGERPDRTGELILELQKSNLGRLDQAMRFSWDATSHLFLGRQVSETAFDRKHRDREEQAAIVQMIKACADKTPSTIVPAARSGPRTAVHVLAAHPGFPALLAASASGKRRFWQHVDSLIAMGALAEQDYRTADRHSGRRLVCGNAGNA